MIYLINNLQILLLTVSSHALFAGLLIERGSDESNVAFFWDEGEDKFKFATTTGASSATDLSGAALTTNLAPIQAGDASLNDVVANTLKVGSVDLGTTDEFNDICCN